MAKVFLNSFGHFNRVPSSNLGTVVVNGVAKTFGSANAEALGSGAQVFDGACSQDRVAIAASGAFNNAVPSLTVVEGTDFVQVVTDGTVLVWSGKPAVDAALKQSRAAAIAAGTYAFEVHLGDVVHVWTAP